MNSNRDYIEERVIELEEFLLRTSIRPERQSIKKILTDSLVCKGESQEGNGLKFLKS